MAASPDPEDGPVTNREDDPPTRRGRLLRMLRRPAGVRHSAPTVAAALLLLAACSQPSPPSPTTTHSPSHADTPQGPYVALGDSYTSGTDIPDQVGSPAGCDRSDRNYPTLLARHFKLAAGEVHDVSCSGATIADLSASQNTSSGVNPAQLSVLTSSTRLVTLGIGGNDLDFSGVLTRCVEMDAPGTILDLLRNAQSGSTPCRSYYTDGGTDQIRQKIQTVQTGLAAALARIHRLAPRARVFVVGYPDLLPADGAAGCSNSLAITPGDVAYLDGEELQLNSMLRQQAAAAHDTFVDTYTPSLGHDACSAASTRWIEPLLTRAAAPLHPNAFGQQGIADAVERAVFGRS